MRMLETVGKRGFAYAWQILRNRDDALDAVQTAVAAVWQHRRKLEPGRDPRGWFYRVLRNKCIDAMRSRRTHQTASLSFDVSAGDGQRTGRGDGESGDPSAALDREQRLRQLRAALAELSDEMREIVLLRDYHDLPYAEIAQVLDIPQGTVMSRLHRARSALRERLLAREV